MFVEQLLAHIASGVGVAGDYERMAAGGILMSRGSLPPLASSYKHPGQKGLFIGFSPSSIFFRRNRVLLPDDDLVYELRSLHILENM
jgi:hypothetical protein